MGAASEVRAGRSTQRRWWCVLAPGLWALLSACAPAVGAGGHAASGKVTLGPQCGGPQREGQSCDVDYAAVEVQLLDSEGRVTAAGHTDALGRFLLSAPAGRYTLRVVSPKVVRCPAADVQLPATKPAALLIACDSGRR